MKLFEGLEAPVPTFIDCKAFIEAANAGKCTQSGAKWFLDAPVTVSGRSIKDLSKCRFVYVSHPRF